jgi:hypothetical protein
MSGNGWVGASAVPLPRVDDRQDDVVTNTCRGSNLLDAATGLEQSADLRPPLILCPLAPLGDSPQCFEYVIRHPG